MDTIAEDDPTVNSKLWKQVQTTGLQGRALQRQSFVEKPRLAVEMPQHAGRSAGRQQYQYPERLPMEQTRSIPTERADYSHQPGLHHRDASLTSSTPFRGLFLLKKQIG